jgi:hypothetical protein
MTTFRFLVLVLQAWTALVLFDLASLRGFGLVHRLVRQCPVARRQMPDGGIDLVCRAVEEACVWYVKSAYCLQRSAVTTWLLRRRGVPATVVIGYRPVPIDSHAWVEVDGKVVNDRPQYQKFFQVLERL